MTLEINLDPEAGSVRIVLDDYLVLNAYKDLDGKIIYSKNFSAITEDDIYKSTRKVCEVLLMGIE